MQCSCNNHRPGLQCPLDATVVFSTGCVHEHIGESPSCARHADRIRVAYAKGEATCTHCRDSIDPHDCTLTITERPTA